MSENGNDSSHISRMDTDAMNCAREVLRDLDTVPANGLRHGTTSVNGDRLRLSTMEFIA